MTLPKDKKPKKEEIDSMKIAVKEVDIRAIHPDKMEDFAAHMVEQLKEETQSFYDKLWELLETELGDTVFCDQMADRIYDLVKEHYND
jgi:hypothetical protein